MAPSIRYFGWRADRLSRDGDVSRRVLARGDDLVFLDGLRRRRSEHANAWRALNAKPTRMRVLLNRVTLSLAGGVRTLLKLIRQERPSLMDEIDPDGLAWWDHHFARPQIPAELGFTAFLGVLVSTLVLPASRWFGPMPWALLFAALASFGVAAAVLLGGLYGVARPRHVWLTSKQFGAPIWKRLGWRAATLALVLVAALAPASPWVTPAIAIAVLWLVYWVLITGEPNRNPGPRYPWPVRALFNFAYLGIFWMIMAAILPPARWMQMSLPIVGGMVVFTWGAGSLYDAVRDEIGETARRGLAWFLAAVSMLAFVAVASVHDHAALEAIRCGVARRRRVHAQDAGRPAGIGGLALARGRHAHRLGRLVHRPDRRSRSEIAGSGLRAASWYGSAHRPGDRRRRACCWRRFPRVGAN